MEAFVFTIAGRTSAQLAPVPHVPALTARSTRRSTELARFSRRAFFGADAASKCGLWGCRLAPGPHSFSFGPIQDFDLTRALTAEEAQEAQQEAQQEATIEEEALQLLEWSRVCEHLSSFAATKLGAAACRALGHAGVPRTRGESERLLAETREVHELEGRWARELRYEGIRDIAESVQLVRIPGYCLTGRELYGVATTLAGARQLRRQIEGVEGGEAAFPALLALVAGLTTHPDLERAIKSALDPEGGVEDSASPKLAQIRARRAEAFAKAREIMQGCLQRYRDALQEPIVTTRNERFVIPIKAVAKDAVGGIVLDVSNSGLTLFVEPRQAVSVNNALRQLARAEEEAVREVLLALSDRVREVWDDVSTLLAIVTALDCATARARYAAWLRAACPRLADPDGPEGGALTLTRCRHPLLAWQHAREGGPEPVPVDVALAPGVRVVCITGPNTGGKTVTLKTVGLACLMAKAGMFVAADEPAVLPWFDRVLADIGDEQSIVQSLSTFSGHVRRIRRILRAATPRSLVLLDEVGGGTDPQEGAALGIALLRSLAGRAAATMATTHFGELKTLKYQDPRFENASVEFDDETLSPTYRLLWGIPGRSNALAIAERLGMEEEIVAAARGLLVTAGEAGGAAEGSVRRQVDMDAVIAGMEGERRELAARSEAARARLEEAEALRGSLQEQQRRLQRREREVREAQERAVGEAAEAARAEIAAVIRSLQEGGAGGRQAARARAAVDDIAGRFLAEQAGGAADEGEELYVPRVGDRVSLRRLGSTAEVVAAPSGGQVLVKAGLMQMKVPLADVYSVDGVPAAPSAPSPAAGEGSAAGEARRKQTPPPPPPPPPPSGAGRKKAAGGSVSVRSSTPVSGRPPAPASGGGKKREPMTVRMDSNTADLRGLRVDDAEAALERALNRAHAISDVLYVIHGHGTGQLKAAVHDFLRSHPLVARYEVAREGAGGLTLAFFD